MEVRPGYKQTDVGVIPEEWEIKSVRDIGQIKTGPFGTILKAAEYSGIEGVPLISVGEVGAGQFRVTEHTPRVPEQVTRRLPQYVLRCGDIVFGRKGAVERSALVTAKEDGWFLGSDGISIRPQKSCFPPYLACQFQRHEVQSWLLQNAIGTTMASLNQGILGRVQIPCAPLPEQRTIAEALSDVDGLLGALDRLIAKKRNLKQAAMQQLLTGKTRFPGFHGEWVMKKLGDLFDFSGGYSASRDQLSTEGHCYLHYGDIHGSTKTSIDADADFQSIPKLNIPLKRVSSASLLDDGDVVFVDASEDDAGTSKHVVVVNKSRKPFISGLHTIVAKSKTDELAHGYRRYCFQTPGIREQFLFYSVGTKVSGISKSNIPKLTLCFPGVREQAAIAEVLTEVDAELAGLEQRREKTRALKQAMMQELLTGRTRLIPTGGARA